MTLPSFGALVTSLNQAQTKPAVFFAAPKVEMDNSLKALFFGILLALTMFAGGAVASQDSPLGALAPDDAAACGFLSTFNAKIDDSNSNDGSDTDYSASGAASGYAGTQVRVFITSAGGDGGQMWCNLYKFNAFSETSTSASQWTYMGFDASASGPCDYIANSRTSHRGYFFRGTAGDCATNVWAVSYDPPSYGEGANAGWLRNLSCTTYADPYAAWTTTGSAQKPHAGCQGTTVGMSPAGIDNGIFIDTVAPTAPSWALAANANAFKSGNTLYFRKVANTISVTLSHTETLTSTKSGGQSFSWAALSATTGWTYTGGEVASTTTSTKTLTSSTTSVNATLATDSNDRSDNDGTNLTITLTADTTLPTAAWVAPTAQVTQAASSYLFDWTESDVGAGVKTRNLTLQTANVTSGACGTFSTASTINSHTTDSYTYSGMVNAKCYRLGVAVVDNVSNTGTISYSPAVLINTAVPTATISVDSANAAVYRNGDIVYFRAGVAGSVNISVSGSNPGGGATDQRFNALGGTGTGWTPTAASAYVTTNPYTLSYAWTSAAAGTRTLNGTVRNAALATANTATLTLTPDATAPAVSFNYPTGAVIYSPDPAFTVDLNVTEAGSGFARAGAGWTVQRQRATISSGSCGTYSNNGTAFTGQTTGSGLTVDETDLVTGYCYRWVLTGTDSVGQTANVTSTVVRTDLDEAGATWTSPSPSSNIVWDADGAFSVAWTELPGPSGIASRALQLQTAPFSVSGCGTFDDEGGAVTTASPVAVTLQPDLCHRWILTLTSGAGGESTFTSASVAITPPPPTTTGFTNPETDREILFASDFETGGMPAGWPGSILVDGSGNHYVNGAGKNTTSPAYPVTPGDIVRIQMRVNSDGPWSWTGLCFRDSAGANIGECYPRTEDGAWNDTLSQVSTWVAIAPSNAVSVIVYFYNSYGPGQYDDVSIDRLWTPTTARQPASVDLDLAWNESGVGLTRSLQRQVAEAASLYHCRSAIFTNDGAASAPGASPLTVTDLEAGNCYRWTLTLTDSAGQKATAYSGVIYIDPAPAPQADFSSPDEDMDIIFTSDFTDPDQVTTWPGGEALISGDYQRSLGGITDMYYGPKFAAAPGEHFRWSASAFPAGPHAWFGMCFYRADNTEISCPSGAQIAEGDHRATLEVREATAPALTAFVAIQFYHAYYTSYYDDLTIEKVLTTADSAVQSEDAVDIAWTETVPTNGLAITSRSLQRQIATASNIDGCDTAAFTNDGAADTSVSPASAAGLLDGKCYRWALTLTDADGTTSDTVSGVRYIIPHQLTLRHVPTVGVGNSAAISVVVNDREGQPRDDFSGVLTISTDDTGATFPGGNTYTLNGAEDLTGHTFEIRFATAGEHTITVRATNAEMTTSTITVTEVDLTAVAPATVYAGVPFSLEVTPIKNGEYDPRYSGVVTFSSSDTTATYSRTTGTPPKFTFECNCNGSESFATRLTTLGSQTITVQDAAGNSDTVTVNVVAAPGGIASPVQRIDRVKWNHGNTVDWYVTAVAGAQPFTILEATNSCNQPSSGVGLQVEPNTDRFVEFHTSVSKPICDDSYLSDISHTLIIADDAGHTWTLSANGAYSRFSSVPSNTNFTMLDPGDPVAYMATTARPGGTTLANGPDGRRWAYGHGSLQLEFFVYEPTSIVEMYLGRPGISGYVQPWMSPQSRFMDVGQNWVSLDDITHTCYIGGSMPDASSGWLTYGTGSGREGSVAAGGGILAGPGSPTVDCGTPTSGDDGNQLDDLIDALNPDNWPLVGDISRFMAADPVDPFTGGFTQSATDFSLGGISPALQMSRSYRADRAERAAAGDTTAAGAFGPGWGSSIDQRLTIINSGARVEWHAADGGVSTFIRNSTGAYGGVRSDVTLTASGGNYRLETNAGSALLFNGSGKMTAIEDRDGRQLTFAYDGNGNLDSMTDAASRTADITVNGAGQITRVDLPDGRYVAFTYANGYLASARSLSGTIINYVTDTRGRLTELRNAANDILLHNEYDDRGRVISQDDAAGNTTWFVYDADGLMTQVIDPRGATTTDCFLAGSQVDHSIDALGNTTAYTYDSARNPSSTTDALGRVTTFVYNSESLPTKVTDPLGRTQTITYNTDNLVTKVTDHEGNTVTPSYDANGRPQSVVRAEPTSDPDPQSLEMATYTYNALGLPETITTPGGAGATMSYNATGYLTGVTDAEGRQITYTVDARGFVTAMVDPLGNATGGVPADHTSSYTYDNAGRVLTATNAEDETTTYTYDAMGRLLTTESPLGTLTTNTYDDDGRVLTTTTQLTDTTTATTSFDYDDAGNLIRITDAEDRETEFEYDLLGRQVLQRDPNGEEWLTEYDALGRVTKTTDPTGRISQTLYDAAGRVAKTIDAAGKETTYAYNDRDQLVTITDPLNRVTTNTYDWLGRQTELTNAEQETTISVFNDAGDLLSITDAEGKATTFTYDDTHRLLEVVDAALGETTFGYDAAGRMTTRTNARDKSETFAYDAAGRQISVTDADGSEWTTAYDADGRIDFTIDGKGQTTEFTFDRAGRLLSIDPAGSMAPITYTYDDTGRQLTMSDPEGESSFAYDNVGRLTSAVRDSQTVGYTYDEAGRPTSVVYPGSTGSVDYTYDNAGRLATISDWADRTTTMAYDDASRVTSLARPGGLSTSFVYDDVDRLLNIDHVKGGSSLLELTYTYDDVGNVLTYTDDSGTTTFGYNDLHQLTSADYPGGTGFTYTYDAVGNMTGLAGAGGAPAPDTAAPTVPSGVGATAVGADRINLTWTASTDNVGVLRYRIYRGGTQISEVSGSSTSFSDRSVAASTAYSYTVAAVDAAGNASAQSSAANATSGAAGGTPGTSTKAPSSHDSGWTNSANTYASDNVYATAAPAKNGTTTVNVGTFGFGATIPSNATITGVTVTVEWNVSTNSSIATLGSQLYVGATAQGTELVNSAEPTTDAVQTYTVSGLTRADLLDGTLTIRARASRGNSNTAFTANLDAISIKVDYNVPPPADTTAPSVPTGLNAIAVSPTRVDLAWTVSTDNTAVQGYRVYRGGTLIATTASPSYADTNRTDGTAYSYTVAAIDGAGNASSQASAVNVTTPDADISLTRTYSDGDRLLTENDGTDTRTFTYDDNGSMTDDGAGRTFTYDAMGRLTSVNGAADATYAYDGAGHRISATVDSVTTDFLLDIRGMGSVLSDGTRRFLPGGPNGGYEQGGNWVNALTNHQGTVLGYADNSGLVGSLTHFDPYGSPLPGSTAPTSGPGFTGEWTDATGLVNLRARNYDPTLQAFFGRDTFSGVASAPLSGNRYAYAMGNPLRYTDPSGHFVNEFMRDPGMFLSMGLQMVPGIGDAYSLFTGFTGFDPIAGVTLSGLERGLAMAAALPFVPNLGRIANKAGDLIGAGINGIKRGASRAASHLDDLGRARWFNEFRVGRLSQASDVAAHNDAVGRIAGRLSRDMGDSSEVSRLAEIAGTLHDCGKCRPDILAAVRDPGTFNPIIREHPGLGADWVRTGFGDDVADVVLHHHPHYGNVWPDGLGHGLNWVNTATRRVIAADVFHATVLDSTRLYRGDAWPVSKALEMMKDMGFGREELLWFWNNFQ